MPELKKVYIVTSGSYSDYGIVGVFDDLELAELAAANIRDANDVEVHDLNPDEDKYRAGLKMFVVDITKDGTVCDVRHVFGHTSFVLYRPNDSDWILRTAMWVKDEKQAIKVASERRSFLLAESLWPERSNFRHQIQYPWEKGNSYA